MTSLLVIIYLAFISLGLPDSLLGSAWPAMYQGLGVPISSAGIISMIISTGTIVSSLFSHRLIRRFGTGVLTLVSVAMTAVALFGFSISSSFFMLCLLAIPMGLGAGSVDSALNNFVALHYKAAHMSWLHCFWGVGASAGPIILSYCLLKSGTWTSGYQVISIIQFVLVAVLLCSLPLWKRGVGTQAEQEEDSDSNFSLSALVRLPKAKPTLVSFFCYCSLEATVMLWGSSYLVVARNTTEDVAAGWISMFFFGITLGRLLSGFLAMRFIPRKLIRLGQCSIGLGIVILFLPLPSIAAAVGLFCIGLGCAPIYPCLLHETPNTFGKDRAQAIMGMQMACAYTGSTLMPPFFGLLGSVVGYRLLPFYLAVILALMVFMVTMIYGKKKKEVI